MVRKILSWLLISIGVILCLLIWLQTVFLYTWRLDESTPHTYALALADLDGDGDQDAFIGRGLHEGPQPNQVWLNQGGEQEGEPGQFVDSGQRLGRDRARMLLVGDLDADGDLDVLVTGVPQISLYENLGRAEFAVRPPVAAAMNGYWAVDLGDVDGDLDLDLVVGACCGPEEPFSTFLLNQGGAQGGASGIFHPVGPKQAGLGAEGAALGDLDGDGDLDLYFANNVLPPLQDGGKRRIQANTVWWNDGEGNFVDSGQRLGSSHSKAVALGDIDGDGDLDAWSANVGPDWVWLNAGGRQAGQPGAFVDSHQRLGDTFSVGVELLDLNGDAALDAAVLQNGDFFTPVRMTLWINNGQGNFRSGGRIRAPRTDAFAWGDLDDDGDPDLLAVQSSGSYDVWWNNGKAHFSRSLR